jgi:hydroxyacylglutathione hydrolase
MGKLQFESIVVTPFEQNCTVLYDSDTLEGVVVDPGGDVPAVLEMLRKNKIKVSAIWLTHGHIDHAGGADELREALGVKIIGPHVADLWFLQNIENRTRELGVDMQPRNVVTDRWLSEGDTVCFGNHKFSVFHTPGHSPGHIIFFNDAQSFAYLGDMIFHGIMSRSDLPFGSHADLVSSLTNKVFPLGDNITYVCGHGPGGNLGEERRTNPFLRDL